jgi:hypothetical protein
MTNEQIEVLRYMRDGHPLDTEEVEALLAAISLAERVRDAERTDCGDCQPLRNPMGHACDSCGGSGQFLLLRTSEG